MNQFMLSKIGIMADSHGSSETIKAAIEFFRQENCRPVFHLGDICDSHRPETADECVRLLQENDVLAIKGNNDYAILLNQDKKIINPTTHRFLENLPLAREENGAAFVHSLPFVEELGLSAMIGTMRNHVAARFFQESSARILFRGHSHSPQIIRRIDGQIRKAVIREGEKIDLHQVRPCIITCGALTEGLCMIWNRKDECLYCLSFS